MTLTPHISKTPRVGQTFGALLGETTMSCNLPPQARRSTLETLELVSRYVHALRNLGTTSRPELLALTTAYAARAELDVPSPPLAELCGFVLLAAP